MGRDLRESCVREAFAIVGEVGVNGLSIREVARRLGVSHQAPYKHFGSADALLAEIVRRAYEEFSAYLAKRPKSGVAHEDMHSLGVAYVAYARKNPMHYRLMFGTLLPAPEQYPETMEAARAAFGILLRAIHDMKSGQGVKRGQGEKEAKLDALFVWATVHGIATIQETSVMEQLGMDAKLRSEALPHALAKIGAAMGVG
jgi:AcrR family transcriptional regulator